MMSILQHVPSRTERLTLWSERVLRLTSSSFDYRRAVRAKRRQIKQIEFLDTTTGCCQHSNEDGSTCIGHLITMSPGHLPDHSMGTQQAKLSANCSRPASSLSGRVGLATIQQLLEIPIAQAVNQKLTVVDGGEQFLVLGPGTETSYPPLTPKGVFLNVSRYFFHTAAVIHRGEGIQQSLIGFLRYLGPPM